MRCRLYIVQGHSSLVVVASFLVSVSVTICIYSWNEWIVFITDFWGQKSGLGSSCKRWAPNFPLNQREQCPLFYTTSFRGSHYIQIEWWRSSECHLRTSDYNAVNICNSFNHLYWVSKLLLCSNWATIPSTRPAWDRAFCTSHAIDLYCMWSLLYRQGGCFPPHTCLCPMVYDGRALK